MQALALKIKSVVYPGNSDFNFNHWRKRCCTMATVFNGTQIGGIFVYLRNVVCSFLFFKAVEH